MRSPDESPGSGRTRFLRFLATSGLAAGVNIVSRYILGLAMPYEAAVSVAYLFGMTTAFILARLFVFNAAHGQARRQYVRFALVNAVAFAQVWFISVAIARFIFPAVDFTWNAETIAHIIGVISPVFTSYVGHMHFSFRQSRPLSRST